MSELCPPLTRCVVLLLAAVSLAAPPRAAADGAPRALELRYEVTIDALPPGDGPVDLFLPIAESDAQQTVSLPRIDTPIEGHFGRDAVYGNRFWHVRIPDRRSAPLRIALTYDVERRPFRADPERAGAVLAADTRADLGLYLRPNARVPVDDPMLTDIRREVARRAGDPHPAAISRAIYDWVVDNMEYKKVGSGWGQGDTWWACSERYGNCTDFHALFISLARSEGIPARFDMGLPVPADRSQGTIGGYHCWVQFWLPDVGWVPIDASKAAKHPEQRELLYGTHPADRVRFSTGRDLRLGEHHPGPPLNYFIYPYLERAGTPLPGLARHRFAYRERSGDGTGASAD